MMRLPSPTRRLELATGRARIVGLRDADDTDIQVFWRDFERSLGPLTQPPPQRDELCTVPIGQARDWLKKVRDKHRLLPYQADPQVKRRGSRTRDVAWVPLDAVPWPGLVLMLHVTAGGYSAKTGFDPTVTAPAVPVHGPEVAARVAETLDTDPESEQPAVALGAHLGHVAREAKRLCEVLGVDGGEEVVRAARWHDVGKSHRAFQERLGVSATEPPLAKAPALRREQGPPLLPP